ncbi:molecular chaperone TorD family protein [Shewanella schlegeliana]|uniref:Molecular chaperone TorD family protein n=1 Tax=Shewanella schlegeliana TaxID=190308 RepID=A0ABS1T1F5_9GAMM|nr:molecular chaperone TorD family protein [Shewanella schlegeliana]MBL4913371.1 molecular chaperone TorD family protein [Shewanella schlegeliana]MCL1109326.1 molecular chaperone TorD family protein [Shewanella schlegeliana]GIU38077.1 molecular chaperone TorD [Shewanella schlegeliana]
MSSKTESITQSSTAQSSLSKIDFVEYQGLARILHHCLIRYPEADFINGLKDCDVAGSWPEFEHRLENSNGRQLLGTFLQQWSSDIDCADLEKALISLKLDYGQLFFGPGEPTAVPQGSVYLCEEQLINDRTTVELMDFYRAHGVELQLDYKQPIDHIGLFFAVLDQTFGRLQTESDNQALVRFVQVLLQQHLLPWAMRCCQLANEHAKTDFYRGIALLTADFLMQLQQDFQVLPLDKRLFR